MANLIVDSNPSEFSFSKYEIDPPLSSSSSHSSITSQNESSEKRLSLSNICVNFMKDEFAIETMLTNEKKTFKVVRNYDDFKALHEYLMKVSHPATIIPPLPEMVALEEKRITSTQLKTLNQFQLAFTNSTEFEQYLAAIASHPSLCSNFRFEKFLFEEKFSYSPSTIICSYLKLQSNKWKPSYRDCDDFYENERYCMLTVETKLQEVKNDVDSVLLSTRKLCNVLGHLAVCITSAFVINEPQTQTISFNKAFVVALEAFKTHLEVNEKLSNRTLGIAFQFFFTYHFGYKNLFFQRNELMIKYECANKYWQRHIATKNSEKALADKKQAEKEFEKFSEEGRREIKHYHSHRQQELVAAIKLYGDYQQAMSRNTVTLLKDCIANLKALNV